MGLRALNKLPEGISLCNGLRYRQKHSSLFYLFAVKEKVPEKREAERAETQASTSCQLIKNL